MHSDFDYVMRDLEDGKTRRVEVDANSEQQHPIMAHWQTMLGSHSRGRLLSSNKNRCCCRNLSKRTIGNVTTVSGSCGSSLLKTHRQETCEKYRASSDILKQRRHYSNMLLSSSNNSPEQSASGPSFRGPVPPNSSEDEIVSDSVWELRTGKVR